MLRGSEEFELYTIPSYSSWFVWSNIHEVEKFSLREFFDGSSVTRSPRIYKEYRDFIISKYREDPTRKLTFTVVRKSLVGDASVLLKVFTFLEKWGLINFNASYNKEETEDDGAFTTASSGHEVEEENWRGRVKVEEGAPHGVRVVATPNSIKPVLPPPPVTVDGGGVGEIGESGFKWPPLASYSDIYGELMQPVWNGLVCGVCKDNCDSAHYEYMKEESFILCEKCFKSDNYAPGKLPEDFKLKDSVNWAAVWTEAETSLLLESVLKHGDDWDLVATNVQTKSKLECISKLIQLPFGDLILGAATRKNRYLNVLVDINDSKPNFYPDEPQEAVKEEPSSELHDKDHADGEDESPPLKKMCAGPTTGAGSFLMNELVRILKMLGPHVAASATEAAVAALCYENHCSREFFFDEHNNVDSNSSPESSNQQSLADGDVGEDERPAISEEIQEKSPANNVISLNLRTRAATAAALGAAAANAKLLADQEEREIAHLVATMIETQLKKLRCKMKHFEESEFIMEKEYMQLQKLEESLLAQLMSVVQMAFAATGLAK